MLATCNRIEVFAEVDRFHGGIADVSRVLARHAGSTVEELSDHLSVHYEDRPSGTCSPSPRGWTPWSWASRRSSVSSGRRTRWLRRRARSAGSCTLAQRALRVGKRVHAETGIDRAGASFVSVGAGPGDARVGDLAGRAVLVMGAGSMGALAGTTLARRGRRSPSAAAARARPAGRVRRRAAAGLERLPEELAAADVLVTCTGATGTVIGIDGVTAVPPPGRPAAGVVDLALPARRRPRGRRLPGVHVVDLGDAAGRAAPADEPRPPTSSPPAHRRRRGRRLPARRAACGRGRADRLRAA